MMSKFFSTGNTETLSTFPTLLIVSREADTRFLFETLLCAMGCIVFNCEDITNCAELVESSHPQLILLDVEFPFREDITSLINLRTHKEFDDIPIILISNYSSKYFEELSESLNVCDHLEKPVDFTRLKARMEECLKDIIPPYPDFRNMRSLPDF